MTPNVNVPLAESVAMLFMAKWNVPIAAHHCGLSYDEMKEIFSDYCSINQINPTYLLSK